MSHGRVAVVMPAYNAAETLERTYADVPKDHVDDVILVDDASRDRTVEIARRLGLHVVVHPRNRGYGANQKTCYRTALDRGADVVVMVHPDHQYDPRVIPDLLETLRRTGCDAVFGSRMLAGTPFFRDEPHSPQNFWPSGFNALQLVHLSVPVVGGAFGVADSI